jgi:tetratricopeptide (TPR) repeat protein
MAKKEALDGDYKQAIAILENLLTSNPDEAMAYYLIGEHLYVLKHYPEAIASLTRAAGFNPRLKLVYNVLAYAYNAIGDQTNALAAIDAYIRLAPGEANPYDSRGDFCAMAGRIQEAIEAYRNALAIKPDFGYTQVKLGSLYFFRGEADSAAEYFRAGCRGREYASRSEARLNLACLSLSIGKVGAAMTALDDNIVADRIENGQEKYPSYRFVKAYILELLGQGEEALAEMRQSVALHRINLPQYFQHARAFYAEMLVRQGQIDAARAVLDTMVSDTASPNIPRAPVWYAAAAIAGAEHDYSTAVEYYTRAVAADPTFHLPGRFSLAQALVASRDDERAAVVFSELLANFYQDYALWTLQVARSRYALAVTYERLGRVDDAVMQYAAFLHQWQDADREVADVIDAKRRMARLQSRP